jgi:hypothetical protein
MPGDRRKLQLKADSSILLGSPKQGLVGQYFDLKTRNSYSKCTQVPSQLRKQKNEDELVVVRATPLKPSEKYGSILDNKGPSTLPNSKLARGLSFSDDTRTEESNDTIISPTSSPSRRTLKPLKHSKSLKSPAPADNSGCQKASSVSPLKMKAGLGDMTMQEARFKYKQTYPTNHPPELAHLKVKSINDQKFAQKE